MSTRYIFICIRQEKEENADATKKFNKSRQFEKSPKNMPIAIFAQSVSRPVNLTHQYKPGPFQHLCPAALSPHP